jgi:peptidoglycan/LPS O-acetylase OafA/YrhL
MFFGLGALIYRYKEKALEIRPSVLLLCIFLSLGLLEHYVSLLPSPTIFTGLGLAAFFILMVRVPPLDLPLLAHIGKISYSVYLLHVPIILWCFHNLGHLGKWHVLIAMAIVFAASHSLYILVERPWIRFAQRFR